MTIFWINICSNHGSHAWTVYTCSTQCLTHTWQWLIKSDLPNIWCQSFSCKGETFDQKSPEESLFFSFGAPLRSTLTCTHIKAALGDGGESPEGPSRPQLSAVRQTPGPGRAACCSFDPASSSCWFVQRDFVLAVLLSLCPAAQSTTRETPLRFHWLHQQALTTAAGLSWPQ